MERNEAQGTAKDCGAPAEIRIGRRVLTLLEHLLRLPAPEEGCALLLGERRGAPGGTGPWSIRRVWVCRNVWEPATERHRRFAIDPREQLLAQKWGRTRNLLLLGSAHSHPAAAAVPSAVDLALTLGPTLMLILGRPAGDIATELACWWLAAPEDPAGGDGPAPPQRLPWRMDD